MATNKFITNTASLKTTVADIRKLDTKKINAQTIFLDGENIRDIINNATPTIKHSQDTRETVTENDLWGQWVETKDDGTIVVHDDYLSNPNGSSNSAWISNVKAVQDNKAYSVITTDTEGNFTGVVEKSVIANIQTEMINDGYRMFNNTPLTSFSGDLSSLTNGESMFRSCSNLTSFSGDLSSLTNGSYMFRSTALTSFSGDLSNLTNGYYMFTGCSKLTSFSGDLSSLTNGTNMFDYCSNLTSFSGDLSNLTDGSCMFRSTALTSFSGDLSNLTDGSYMFKSATLTTFDSDLSSLTNGRDMFYDTPLNSFSGDLSSLTYAYRMFYSTNLESFSSDLSSLTDSETMFDHCNNLTSFTSDLSSLVYAYGMFDHCNNLTSFTSDLSSLVNGNYMLRSCKLTPQSVMYILESIRNFKEEKAKYTNGEIPWVTKDSNTGKYSAPFGFMQTGSYVYTYNNPNLYTSTISSSSVGKLTLGINVTNNSSTIQQQLEDFAKEATYDSWEELKQEFVDKGWTVTFQYGDTGGNITYDLKDGEQIIPCPIFAKLVQVEDKDTAEYCTEDASSFYNIEWGHDVTDTTDYTQFNSLEDAAASWNVFPKENIITEEEA